MTEIGLFPLDVVLLPGERIPLHVFEPRYRELIGECLEADAPFGLILQDGEGMRGIGTLATVTEVLERFDDGRLNIVVVGGERFAVQGLTEGRSFTTAMVEAFDDGQEAADPAPEDVARCLRAFRTLVEEVGAEAEQPDLTAGSLAFELAGRVAFDPGAKQGLLELRSELARVDLLTGMLDRAVDQVRRRSQIRERAAGNGHVEP